MSRLPKKGIIFIEFVVFPGLFGHNVSSERRGLTQPLCQINNPENSTLEGWTAKLDGVVSMFK